MTLTCANCGYVNTTTDQQTAHCPNCGAAYSVTSSTQGETVPLSLPLTPAVAPLASSPPPANRRRAMLLGVGLALLVVVVLGGGIAAFAATQGHPTVAAAASTPTPVPTLGAKAPYQKYSDPNGQFTITYPSDWTTSTSMATIGGESVPLTSFVGKNAKGAVEMSVTVAVGGTGVTLANVPDVLTANNIHGFTASGAPTTVTAKKGTAWQKELGTAQTMAGKSVSIEAALTQKGGHSYLLVGFTIGKVNKTFTKMLDSLTFAAA